VDNIVDNFLNKKKRGEKMREILFRGKKNDNWIYGDLINQYPKIYIGSMGYVGDDIGYLEDEIIPETLGQYTGMKDKNGNKVFEGDIISSTYYGNSPVEYYLNRFTISYDFGKAEENTDFNFSEVIYEVIGNIYDNPELLEVKND
jgi:uncharacterized phage protein (TIGR01671 family)